MQEIYSQKYYTGTAKTEHLYMSHVARESLPYF
jgi:hypothetical protein